jgi:hypothetical protein
MGRRRKQRRGSGAAQKGYAVSGSSYPRSHSRMRRLRSASRATPSRLRRNWGSWGRQQLQSGEGALAELVDEAAVSEDAVHLPVGRDRPQAHFHVPLGRKLFFELFG